jgi:protein CLEC16A
MFLELFEAEVNEIIKRPLQVSLLNYTINGSIDVIISISFKVEYLLQDSSVLLPPTGTPMTGIEFTKRLPCGEV